MSKISICELIMGVLLLVFNYTAWQYSKIAITILAIILIIHSLVCKKCCCGCNCDCCDSCEVEKPSKKAKRR